MVNIEQFKTRLVEQSDNLTALQANLEVIKCLETQIEWLHEDFETAAYKKRDVRYCFEEWRTNITVIHSLFNRVMNDVREDNKILKHLNKELEAMVEETEKADALTSTSTIE